MSRSGSHKKCALQLSLAIMREGQSLQFSIICRGPKKKTLGVGPMWCQVEFEMVHNIYSECLNFRIF